MGKAVLLTILFCMGLLLPFLYYYLSDWDKSILQWSTFSRYSLDLKDIFTTDYTLYYIALSVLMIILMRTMKIRIKGFWKAFAIVALFFLMSTSYFPWKPLMQSDVLKMMINMLQKPERFLTIVSPIISILFGITAARSIRKAKELQEHKAVCTAAITLGIVAILAGTAYQYGLVWTSDILTTDLVTADIYSKLQMDYVPTGTKAEDFYSDSGRVVPEAQVESLYYEKDLLNCDYTYNTEIETAYAEFPFLYYPGYGAFDESGNKVEVMKGDHSMIRAYLNPGNGKEIHLRFSVPVLFTVLYIVSLACWILFAARIIWRRI